MSVRFRFGWVDAGPSPDRVSQSTMAALSVEAGGSTVTSVLDRTNRIYSDEVVVPLFSVAEWLIDPDEREFSRAASLLGIDPFDVQDSVADAIVAFWESTDPSVRALSSARLRGDSVWRAPLMPASTCGTMSVRRASVATVLLASPRLTLAPPRPPAVPSGAPPGSASSRTSLPRR